MFSTKKDAVNWIKCFSGNLKLEARKLGKYWRIYGEDGFRLSVDEIHQLEDSKL